MLGNDEVVVSEQSGSERAVSEQWIGEQYVTPELTELAPAALQPLAVMPSTKLTIAHLLLGGILLMASVLLFAQIDALPLSSAESTQALPLYQFINGQIYLVGSPAYFSLSVLLSPLVGHGDVGARIVPALFGLMTVGATWLLRRQIGTVGALVAALLLAISPTTNALAHAAGGQSIAIFAALLLCSKNFATGCGALLRH